MPCVSVRPHVTVVTPMLKVEPEGGEQVAEPDPSTASDLREHTSKRRVATVMMRMAMAVILHAQSHSEKGEHATSVWRLDK